MLRPRRADGRATLERRARSSCAASRSRQSDELHGDARRPLARGRREAAARDLHAARRGQQGHLGPVRRVRSAPSACCRRSNRPVELSRGGSDLPSRAADNLYWLGRYAERAEGVARLARVRVRAPRPSWSARATSTTAPSSCRCCARCTRRPRCSYTAPAQRRHRQVRSRRARRSCSPRCSTSSGAGSLVSVVRATLRAGRLVRDRISTDTWRVLAALDDELQRRDRARRARSSSASLHDVLNRVVLRLAAFSGLVMESMTRGQAWRFLDMGRRLERALGLVTLLRATLTERSRARGPAARSRARDRRQRHDLPAPLSGHAAGRAGAWTSC